MVSRLSPLTRRNEIRDEIIDVVLRQFDGTLFHLIGLSTDPMAKADVNNLADILYTELTIGILNDVYSKYNLYDTDRDYIDRRVLSHIYGHLQEVSRMSAVVADTDEVLCIRVCSLGANRQESVVIRNIQVVTGSRVDRNTGWSYYSENVQTMIFDFVFDAHARVGDQEKEIDVLTSENIYMARFDTAIPFLEMAYNLKEQRS